MRWAPALVVTVMVSLTATVPAGHMTDDDAGSGRDAGDSPDDALEIVYASRYLGNLSRFDRDWYVVEDVADSPSCVRARATTIAPAMMAFGLTSDDDELDVAFVELRANEETSAGWAASQFEYAYLGFGATTHSHNPQPYSFDLERVGLPTRSEGDAGTGSDAGETLANALRIRDACTGGRLSARSLLPDRSDVYSLALAAQQPLLVSFAHGAGANLTLSLLDSGGTVFSSVENNGSIEFVAPQAGTYYLRASLPDSVAVPSTSKTTSSSTDSAYIIGTIVGPPGSPCRPTCRAN